MVQRLESMIANYMNVQFKARWTLKITWENAPAFPVRLAKDNQYKTNTYQAVLTTDGYTSYILMLYGDGKMNWDVTNRIDKLAIGYSSGNRNGFFKNDALMKRPAAEKYRPSNYVDIDPGLRGLWMYPLNSETLENNQMKCLSWYNSESSPSLWNSNLLSCPCLYEQGLRDSRYRRTKAGQTKNTKILRSTSPNRHRAGVRCLYNKQNLFIEGYQEKTWVSSDNDVESQYYDVCCNQVSDPRFCLLYHERRPSINCRTYRPLSPGWMYGDPHITTLDGLSYTFNGLGEFHLLNASSSDISLTLQGRTVQTDTAMATNFEAFALQYSSTTAHVQVEWYLGINDSIAVYVDGQLVSYKFSDDMEAQINDTNPAVFLLKSDSITGTFEGQLSVSVSASLGLLYASVSLPNEFINKTKGLMGTWNYDQKDDFLSPNGTTIPFESTEEEIFRYGMTWIVSVMDSLFLKQKATTRQTSTFIPTFSSDLKAKNPETFKYLLSLCQNNTECVYDALITNNTAVGLSTGAVRQTFQETNNTLNTTSPVVSGNTNIQSFIGLKVSSLFSTSITGATFYADVSYKDVNISGDGLLTWLPTSTDGFTMRLVATDSKNISSSVELTFVLCDCRVQRECDYSQLSRVNTTSVYIAACNCSDNYTGTFCKTKPDPCTEGCFPGVECDKTTGCGPCPAGLTGDGKHCSDVDECAQNNTCSPNAVCTNTWQSYNCTCKQGFSGNGTYCTDINECLDKPCPEGATCSNNEGGFTCSCQRGFTVNGTQCVDIDECLNNPCSANAICNNTQGNYTCTCKNGFTGNGISCVDVNECLNNPCSINASCTNIDGSYACTCKPGFTGNGTYCADLDECLDKPCATHAVCTNTPGNFVCTCKAGYTGNGTYCEDVNECLSNPCPFSATCSNTEGSYTCACKEGFIGNGTVCSCDVCEASYCSNGGTCSRVGAPCTQTCTCHPAFTDDRCRIAGNSFPAQLIPGTRKRSLILGLRSTENVTLTDAYSKVRTYTFLSTRFISKQSIRNLETPY
uniref:Mucin-like protein n=1 Tax=Leptobrachium leishanense TaxID=445787 RepID=A0A8C5N0R0_9ANUR